ncbi:bifunctional helix-turn-helix transcriptional regulator/GNAT family N-acetyltransferase [Ilumatobacter sp.]|uniref:bifunctional helix-turn-helix transcriptional regulator/GNAT family N-acetyltransferase n=1 Tax=Ilumatobacter sp. TaxID=1967498 RepID=UPI003C5F9E20
MNDDPVAVLRGFNRSFTARIGVLDESFLGTGRPLAVARLLFEIGIGGDDGAVPVHVLRERLGADSGYVSRLLRQLESDDLIELHDDPTDGRRRIAHLTDVGREAWNDLDRRSDRVAADLLSPLTTDQTTRLAAALRTADGLMRCSSIVTEVVDPDAELADGARRRYFDELDRRFRDGFDVAGDSAEERSRMAPPHGAFLVLVDDGDVVGCGGVHRLDGRVAEIKRMWLDPGLRGLGMGRRLLGDLESAARDLGCGEVVLDTNDALTTAIAMYRGAGYEPTERYNTNPYADLWFRKRLR